MASQAQKRPLILQIILISILVVWMLAAAFPFFWTLWGSFKVEGDFFSLADWTNVLTGDMTIRETGGAYTTQGYSGAWIQEEFWKAAYGKLKFSIRTMGWPIYLHPTNRFRSIHGKGTHPWTRRKFAGRRGMAPGFPLL